MRILSGITPSSSKGLHIGNYFGAIKQFLELQNTGECYFFVANLHALNTVHDPAALQDNVNTIFLEYLACGIDPQKTVFFVESDVPEIPYLQTILNNAVTVAELKRMHGYKDKLAHAVSADEISAGLFEYPVLMAADILVFRADVVPVGEDQTQHVEITREIARTFNLRYGSVLRIPELRIQKETARIPGIDGKRKMSKSLGNDIPLFAPDDVIRTQIMAITTDPARVRPTDPGDPDKNICFEYLKLCALDPHHLASLKNRYAQGTVGDVEIKHILIETCLHFLAPMRKRKDSLLAQKDQVLSLRKEGAQKARHIASHELELVKRACGLSD